MGFASPPYTRYRTSATKVQSLFDLPDAEVGDYGPVIVVGGLGDSFRIGIYDDDVPLCGCDFSEECCGYLDADEQPPADNSWRCDCGVENCPVHQELIDSRRKDKWKLTKFKGHHTQHYPLDGFLVITNFDCGGSYMYEIFDNCVNTIKTLPKLAIGEDAFRPDWAAGFVYVVAPNPDLSLHRLKVGWTSRPMYERMKAFRTSAPHAMLLGLFPAVGEWAENEAHRVCNGQINESEVFDVTDPWTTLESVEQVVKEHNSRALKQMPAEKANSINAYWRTLCFSEQAEEVGIEPQAT